MTAVDAPPRHGPSVWPAIDALWQAVRRDLATFASIVVNNFFLFAILVAYGDVSGGVVPVAAYPFLGLIVFLMLFPMAGDPLAKIPAARLALWPLDRLQRFALRAFALALNPVLWLAALAAIRVTRSPASLALVAIPFATHNLAPAQWQPLRHIPAAGGLIGKNLRQMLCVLDIYLAALMTALALAAHVHSIAGAPAGMAMLVALAMSTYAQCLFSLDGDAGLDRYRLFPLAGWRILLAKDIPYLAILFLLVLPIDAPAGLAFGLTSLAIGRHPAVHDRLGVQRWRFTSGRAGFCAAQIAAGCGAALAEPEHPAAVLGIAVAGWLLSLWLGGRALSRPGGMR